MLPESHQRAIRSKYRRIHALADHAMETLTNTRLRRRYDDELYAANSAGREMIQIGEADGEEEKDSGDETDETHGFDERPADEALESGSVPSSPNHNPKAGLTRATPKQAQSNLHGQSLV